MLSEGSPEEWLRYARSDLNLARMSPPAGVIPEALCYHAQQAAEKATKAVLLALGRSFSYTHDIGILLERLPSDVALPETVRDAADLTKYANLSRYPAGDVAPVTEEEHQEAVRLAEATVRWAEMQVKKR